MGSSKISIDNLATEVMNGLLEYESLAREDMKKAVKKAATKVKTEIKAQAPSDTGAYASSWATKTTGESSNALAITVYSKNRYQMAHLLEFGHATRNGGRVAGKSHIAPAEEVGIALLEAEITKALEG